jgi:two-component system LytT family response regulator
VVETIQIVIQAEDSPLSQELEHRIRNAIVGFAGPNASVRLTRVAVPSPVAKGIAVRIGRRVRILDPREILHARSQDDHCVVATDEGSFVVRCSLSRLESFLEPGRWARVHRGHLVRVDRIDGWRILSGGAMVIRMRPQGDEVPVSRSRRSRVRALLGKPKLAG